MLPHFLTYLTKRTRNKMSAVAALIYTLLIWTLKIVLVLWLLETVWLFYQTGRFLKICREEQEDEKHLRKRKS